jgi:hypothetical protein
MTTAQAIAERLQELPEVAQREVLHFVEFLRSRSPSRAARDEEAAWSTLSLKAAMRGMEDEPSPYTSADLKESFR